MNETNQDCEKLFLLEVLVDSLFISYPSLKIDQDVLSNLNETCVMFQFLHYPPLVVCESDFLGSVEGRKEHVTFRSGKSCFFSLRIPKGPILPVPFEVKVTAVCRLREGFLPDKIEIGKTSIQMSDEFTELLRVNTDENCDSLPLSKSKKGVFDIQDSHGKIGTLTAFLRLSCFGKLIITQFSLNKDDEKSYLFKGTEVGNVSHGGQNRSSYDKGLVGLTQGPKELISPYKEDSQKYQKNYCIDRSQNQARTSFGPEYQVERCSLDPCQQKDFATRGKGTCERPQTDPSCRSPYPQPKRAPQERPYDRQIDYRPPCPPQPQQSFTRQSGRGQLCECPYPVPPSVMSKYTQRSCKNNLDLTPGEVGLEDDRVVFQLPLKKQGEPLTEKDKQMDSSVYYKLTSAEETKNGQLKNTVNITSDELQGKQGKQVVGPVSGLPVDDGHDVFLLKIGKKCDGDKKRNLELELRTPKMKEPKPPMSDQNTQYSESDIPKPEGGPKEKAKAGKGKEKKGKKDKKGKKK